MRWTTSLTIATATMASVALPGCGTAADDGSREAFCAGLAFDYPAMVEHVAVPDRDPDATEASVAFLAELYTEDFAAGAPDDAAGRLVVEGAEDAVAGTLEVSEVARYRRAFEELEAVGRAGCP